MLKSEIFVRSAGYESLTPVPNRGLDMQLLFTTENNGELKNSYYFLEIRHIRIFNFNYFIFERKSVVENIKIQSYNLTTQSPIFK